MRDQRYVFFDEFYLALLSAYFGFCSNIFVTVVQETVDTFRP